ncbi:hypothetical protein L1987_74223 [Smallanthus sonchifolius]|uniref:Uncharacterized protein n=1 Tax=Smallanthus sonchifolius TaxID=185202 RepID=A0ACB9A6I5_9ASTR|nr:hypothetical protein L1987_74223 [Smallanthus sonchifolius]
MTLKSKILIIGGTGFIGQIIVEAGTKAGHPIYVLARESSLSDPSKSSLIDSFKKFGVTFIIGDLYDHESLVNAIKQVDVVFSIVGTAQLRDQVKIIDAIKQAGNIKNKDEIVSGIAFSFLLDHLKLIYLSLWEKKISKTLEKVYLSEDEVLKKIQEYPVPLNEMLSIGHSVFVKGDQTNFVIESSFGVEASTLYPDVKYTIVDEYLSHFI